MDGNNILRGVVIVKYKSISAFAKQLGWTRQKAHRIVEYKSRPSLRDVEEMSKALGLSLTSTAEFFLHQ